MKKSKFETLSPELQQAYLERGGTIDPDVGPRPSNSISWNHFQKHGREGEGPTKSKIRKNRKWKKKLK